MAIRHGCQVALVLAMWMYLAYRVASDIMGKGALRFVFEDAVVQTCATWISPSWGAGLQQFISIFSSLRLYDRNGVTMRILVVDDDAPSVKMSSFLLREEGYEVTSTDNGLAALQLVEREAPDLVILDVMMPGLDGFEVCRRIRQKADVPIIFLSARGETADKVTGLELGADDYLAKPFEPSELLARVKAVMRRSEIFALEDTQSQLTVGDITLDPVSNRAIFADERTVDLTPIEFRLLHCLMRNAGRILGHDLLMSAVWGYDYEGYSNQIAVYVRRLRLKIEEEPDHPKLLLTARGLGYKFERA